jgi:hypothetical protein
MSEKELGVKTISPRGEHTSGNRVFLIIDEILGERLDHEFLSFLLHVCGDKGSQIESRGAIEGQIVP